MNPRGPGIYENAACAHVRISLTNRLSQTATAIGDAYANVQAAVRAEGPQLPSLGFAYQIKLPTASASAGLGTGRVDHKLRILTSRKAEGWDVDFNAAALVNGASARRGWGTGEGSPSGHSRGDRGHGATVTPHRVRCSSRA